MARQIDFLVVPGNKAETYSNHAAYYLGKANAAEENGKNADVLRDKCQYWMDMETKARDWA